MAGMKRERESRTIPHWSGDDERAFIALVEQVQRAQRLARQVLLDTIAEATEETIGDPREPRARGVRRNGGGLSRMITVLRKYSSLPERDLARVLQAYAEFDELGETMADAEERWYESDARGSDDL